MVLQSLSFEQMLVYSLKFEVKTVQFISDIGKESQVH
jgi:hypothetical protein